METILEFGNWTSKVGYQGIIKSQPMSLASELEMNGKRDSMHELGNRNHELENFGVKQKSELENQGMEDMKPLFRSTRNESENVESKSKFGNVKTNIKTGTQRSRSDVLSSELRDL